MSKKMWTAACAAVILAVAVAFAAAQTPQSSPMSQASSAKKITVTGCIEKAAHTPKGTSGMSGTMSSGLETKFKLTNVALSTSGTAGTSGMYPESGTVASEYHLDAADAKLAPHVGHKVEITGTLEKSKDTMAQPQAGSAVNAPKLKVEKVKMISTTCPS